MDKESVCNDLDYLIETIVKYRVENVFDKRTEDIIQHLEQDKISLNCKSKKFRIWNVIKKQLLSDSS